VPPAARTRAFDAAVVSRVMRDAADELDHLTRMTHVRARMCCCKIDAHGASLLADVCSAARCAPQPDVASALLPPVDVAVRVCARGHFTAAWTAQPAYRQEADA
jgi:hypothetical protein